MSDREKADDQYCEELYQSYLNDEDPEKNAEYPLEECKAGWGLT